MEKPCQALGSLRSAVARLKGKYREFPAPLPLSLLITTRPEDEATLGAKGIPQQDSLPPDLGANCSPVADFTAARIHFQLRSA